MTPAAKIGLFMLLGLVILGMFIVKIEDIPLGERGERLQVDAVFPSAAGIDRQAAVRIAGVRVGKVEAVGLEGSQARLTLSLDPDVQLHEGATARIASLGMLGDKYVEVSPGDPGAPLLTSGATLSGDAPPSFDDVLDVANEIGADVKEVTAALRTSIGGQQGAEKISEIVENVRELTATLKQLIAENQANVNATTSNFRDFSTTLKDELPRIAEKMNALADQLQGVVGENRENLQASLSNIRELSDRLKVSASNLNAITDKIASGEGSIGKLVNDDTTVDNLNLTLEEVRSGVSTLKDTVGRFQRFRLDMTMRTETLPDLDDSRTAFGFDLWTTDKRFFRIQLVDSPFGKRSEKTEVITTVQDDGTTDSFTRTTIRREEKNTFNAQVGYQLLPSTVLRAGLFESEGGVGVDHTLRIAERDLRLSLEAYDFDRDEESTPHLRLEGRLFLNQNLFVSAGWDDPAYSDHSSYLFGGGITWTDEDLKYLLGLAGSAIN